jgi:phosphate transport system permease protein
MQPQTVKSILISKGTSRLRRLVSLATSGGLLLVTSVSMLAVIFIILFIARDALPFFKLRGLTEFFTSIRWYPSAEHAEFGVLAIIFGSVLVTVLATLVAVPLAIFSAVSLSDMLPFWLRQWVKPTIEIIAAIPSVAYGFFALVIFAPVLQRQGGHLLGVGLWLLGLPIGLLAIYIAVDRLQSRFNAGQKLRLFFMFILGALLLGLLALGSDSLSSIVISSGTNALNVSIILGIMALPTIVSVSEDALQSVGRDLRSGSYALGATRAETLVHVVLPAARSGIVAGIILGVMRAIGETMVVWMASGNAAQIPEPWFNVLQPVRTLTATIAGDMGEADHVTGSARYHVLFAMALFLLITSFLSNLISEWMVSRSKKKWGV